MAHEAIKSMDELRKNLEQAYQVAQESIGSHHGAAQPTNFQRLVRAIEFLATEVERLSNDRK